MPFLVKHTWFFQQGAKGWTESLWREQVDGNLGSAFTIAFNAGLKRALLLGSSGQIKAIRVSIERTDLGVPVTGDSFLQYVGLAGTSTETSEDSDTSLQVIMRNAGATKHKFIFLRGIWDNIVAAGGNYLPSYGIWASLLNSWIAFLLSNGYGWAGVDPLTRTPVINYDQNLPSARVLVTAQAAAFVGPFNVPIKVRFQGINVKSVLNGPQLVTPLTSTTCELVKPLAVVPFVSNGFVQTYTAAVRTASTIDAQKIVQRKSGAPLLESRGRQPVRGRI